MNKILIALVLAVVMSGNAYANFITDYFKTPKEMCLVAVEKGRLVEEYIENDNYGERNTSFKRYVYKGKRYQFNYNFWMGSELFCFETKAT